MKLSAINDYLQTLATIGAIVGLILVSYEIRQTNRLAKSQGVQSSWTNWMQNAESHIESGVAATLVKAMQTPDQLTLEDKINLEFYLYAYVAGVSNDIGAIVMYEGEGADVSELLNEIEQEAPTIFGSRFSRAWLQVNKPERYGVGEAIERGLQGVPLGSDLAYYELIDEVAAGIE